MGEEIELGNEKEIGDEKGIEHEKKKVDEKGMEHEEKEMGNEKEIENETSNIDEGKKTNFEPKILGLLCNWCSYAASDLAGISRIQLPTTVRIIRVMCTGSIDPGMVFEAFAQGLDGVVIMGCHPGDCHYLIGNHHAEKKVKMIKMLLAKTDIHPERLHLEWVSAAEGPKFADVVKEFTKRITSFGPNPLFDGDTIVDKKLDKLLGAKHASEGFRLRAVVGRERKLTEEANVYGEKVPKEKFNEWMIEYVNDEYIRNRILDSVREVPKSIEQLAEELGIPTKTIFIHIGRLWKKQIILPVGHIGPSPTYQIAEGV
jgi:F420-non-reducing hydrogenase iron-sulfur subunit